MCLCLAPLWSGTTAKAQVEGPEASLQPPRLLAATAPAWPQQVPPSEQSVGVLLELTVDVEGRARDVSVLESAGEAFDQEALRASEDLRFAPATRAGEPIAARIPFRYHFTPPVPLTTPGVEEELLGSESSDSDAEPQTSEEMPEPEPQLAGEMTLEVIGERLTRETTLHRVESEEIRVIPGTNGDALRAVETLPGVGRPPALDGQIIVRGSAPEDTAVFIDGISIPLAYHFGGLVSVVPAEALSRLDYRPGNFGTEYGRAMGGVIDIGLRAPRSDRFGGVVQFDIIDGRVMLEGPLSKRTRLMVAGRRSWLDAWVGSAIPEVRSAPVYYDGQVMLEHEFSSKTRMRLSFLGADDRLAVFVQPGAQDPLGGNLSMHSNFTRLIGRVDSQLTDNVSLSQTLAFGTERFAFDFGREFADASLYSGQSRTELRARLHERVTGVLGADVQLLYHDTDMRIYPYPTTGEVDGPYFARPTRTFESGAWLTRPAAYAALELTPVDNLRIIQGVRADFASDTGKFSVDPRLTARWDVRPVYPRTTLKSGVGLFHQPPQFQESVKPWGSSGVKSNRALHASLGVEQDLLPGFDVSAEGFYKHLTQLVTSQPSEDDDAGMGALFRNTGRGRVYGSEFLLRYRPEGGRFFGWIAYTLSRSERAATSADALQVYEWDQTHIFSALGNVRLGRGFSLGGRFRYVTGTPYTPYAAGILDLDAGAYAPVPGQANSARLPAFHQLDLRLEKAFELSRAKLLAYLELRNTYNQKNAEAKTYSYDYAASTNLTGLPFLPVIGLRGEL